MAAELLCSHNLTFALTLNVTLLGYDLTHPFALELGRYRSILASLVLTLIRQALSYFVCLVPPPQILVGHYRDGH